MKIKINDEEVVSNSTLEIKEEMLSTSSTILNNCYPLSWEQDKDYVSRYYFPKDYSKCKIYNEVYHPEVPGTTATGTNLSFNYNNNLRWNLEQLQGNTSQNGTPTPSSPIPVNTVTGLQNVEICGKNLCDEIFESGNINNSGQETTSTTTYRSINYYSVNGGQTLICSYTATTGTNLNWCACYDKNKTFISRLTNIKTDPFTLPNNTAYIRLGFYKSGSISLSDFSNVMLVYGSTPSTYEPYNGNTYEINLGKNLYNFNNYVSKTAEVVIVSQTNDTLTAEVANASTWQTIRYSVKNLELNTNYTFKFDFENTNTSSLYQHTWLTIKNSSNTNLFNDAYYKEDSVTFNTGNSAIIDFVFHVTINAPAVVNTITISRVQLEKGSQATTYSEYFTPIELCKIGDYQDYLYKVNNKWYIHKEIGKVVLNGSENWQYYQGKMYITSITDYHLNGIICICDHYEAQSNVIASGDVEQNKVTFRASTSSRSLYIYDTRFNNANDFKTWLSTHNTTVYYQFATPTDTEITNTDLISQLNSIELLNGLNNINVSSVDLSGTLQIHYNYHEAYTSDDIIFCGCIKNTGNISLNPREPHFIDLQVLDFKTLLSEGETLNYVITNKTITEAINQVITSISDYGFIMGDINISNPNEVIGAYSTLNKTAYDVFNYFADITQSKWKTRLIDENTIAIDFYDPSLMPTANTIESNKQYYEDNKIIDISCNYNTQDYRNKQIMTSDEVYANITQTETIIADGYTKTFMCQNKIGTITSITLNGVSKTFATKNEEELGISADFIYKPGETTFTSSSTISAGGVIVITYYPLVKGREIVLNVDESNRITSQINRKGTISRYENRNDTTSSQELQKIGQSYIKYKGNAEIKLIVQSENNLFDIGQIVQYNAPLNELTDKYMVKNKTITMYLNANRVFYTFELSSNYNSENDINYFDNQRAKNQGNIGEGETIVRNIDLENTALIQFYNTQSEEIQVSNPSSLDFALDGYLI